MHAIVACRLDDGGKLGVLVCMGGDDQFAQALMTDAVALAEIIEKVAALHTEPRFQ